jgi:energy-coupling factor transporter ATP-binding protein EcfA2
MSARTPSLRLAAIQLCGYRGFPNPATIWLAEHNLEGKPTSKGRNLLLYGENGSGKSSLGKALRDFLNFRSTAPKFDDFKYRHTDPPRTDRGVKLIFDDLAVDPLSWNPTDRDTAHKDFADMARSCGWLDYRVVWRVSEVPVGGDHVDIFRPLVEDILPGCLPDSGGSDTFGQAWADITDAMATNPTRTAYRWPEVEELEDDIGNFNDALKTFLEKIESRANEFLKSFTPWTSIVLEWGTGASYKSSSRRDKFSLGSVKLKMIDRGENDPLKSPSEFLNEARLTAVGLCLYLAGMSQSIPPKRADGTTYPRLLILDDVLLSLDMTHRLPLIELLKGASFKDWQILLLTHDRAWYEIAKQRLAGWANYELFSQRVGDYDQPLLREDQDLLLQAIDFLEGGQVKAAAVHVRSKFEEVLKWGCFALGLAVKYNPDPRKMSARHFWSAISGASYDNIPPVASAKDARGRIIWWQPKPATQPIVSHNLQERINHALSWVMNPLSHSQSVDRYRPEIEDAIFAVYELEVAVREAVAMRQAGPVMLREMLLSLLKQKATEEPVTTATEKPPETKTVEGATT